MTARARERLVGAAGTALVLGLLGYGLLAGLRIEGRAPIEAALTLLNLAAPPPVPPDRPKPPPPRYAPRPPAAASPPGLRGKATPIVAPPIVLPVPTPVIAAPEPGFGMARTTGAADLAGPGEGAGGIGAGTGGGGDGRGRGDVPPRFLRGQLEYHDLPVEMRRAQVSGTVGIRYGVDIAGRVGDCVVTSSSGDTALDAVTCRLIEQRFRYRPARDGDGRAAHSTIEENHSWIVEPIQER